MEEKMRFDKKLQTDAYLRAEVNMRQKIICAACRIAMAEKLRQLQQKVLKEEGEQEHKKGNRDAKIIPVRLYARIIRIALAVARGAAVLMLSFWIAPLLIIKTANSTLLYHYNGQLIGKIAVKDALFTSDGEHIIGLSDKKELLCYRTADGTFITQYGQLIPTDGREYDPEINNSGNAITTYVGQVMDYDISPDGQRVVTIHTDESALLCEIGGKMISRRKGLPKSWVTETTNPNGTEMIGKMHNSTVLVFSARDFADRLRKNAEQEKATPQLVFKRIAPSEVNYQKLKHELEQS